MATIPENMNEDRICFLANEIAKTFMQGQGKFITGTEDFIKTYIDVYDTARIIIADRELKKSNKGDNMSSNGPINDLAKTLHHSTL